MAAFLSEVDAEPAPAAPKIIAAGPTVISAKPSGPSSHQPGQLSATVVEAGGTVRRLPVSEWVRLFKDSFQVRSFRQLGQLWFRPPRSQPVLLDTN